MRRNSGYGVLFVAFLGVLGYRHLGRSQQTAGGSEDIPERAVAVRLMFGVGARQPGAWDGAVSLSQGSILRTTGVHFEESDGVVGPGQWKCSTRETRYGDSR